jgi:preprotein translocase subunit YajC
MFFTSYAYAADNASANSTSVMDAIQSNFMSFVPMLMIFAVFYFLLIRPQEKKRKEQENLIASVQRGETVITHAGLYGKVDRINESDLSIDLEIAKDVVIKIAKSSIADVVSRKKTSK